MKIEVEIPDEYSKRNLYVFAGVEVVAKNQQGKGWEVKTRKCSRCGECCLRIDERHPLGLANGCAHLLRDPSEQLCGLGIFRPHGCAIADGEQMRVETCTVRWEAV